LLQGEESQSIFKSYDSNQNVASLEKYGNYFLLSIYMKSQDVNKEGTFNDNLKILIDKFLEFTNTDVFKEKWDGKLLESNSFKTNDLYEDFKNFIEKN
ncbi:TPA: hypothetical protein U0K61_000730, partial [Streptococcus suis]|nr:hypothetical protein [Streptococcus suis]